MIRMWEEAHTSQTVEVAIYPVTYTQPFVILHVHRDGYVVLGPEGLEHQVVLQLFQGSPIVPHDGMTRTLHREAEDIGGIWL